MLSWALGILCGVLFVTLIEARPGYLSKGVRHLIAFVVTAAGIWLFSILLSSQSGFWSHLPHSPIALLSSGLGTIFLIEWALLARREPDVKDDAEEKKRLARIRAGLVTMGIAFFFIGIVEVSTPRIIRLVSKVPTPLGAIEIATTPANRLDALLNTVPKQLTYTNKDTEVSDALERIFNLKRFIDAQDRYAAALQNHLLGPTSSDRTASAPIGSESFNSELYDKLIRPIAGCLIFIQEEYRSPSLIGSLVVEPIAVLKQIARLNRQPDKLDDRALIDQVARSLEGLAGTLFDYTKGVLQTKAQTASKGRESCGELKDYKADELETQSLVVSANPLLKPYIALIIADLHAASGDPVPAIFELDRWLLKSRPRNIERQFPGMLKTTERYVLLWREASTRMRLNAYLGGLGVEHFVRPGLRASEAEKAYEALNSLVEPRTLRSTSYGKNCQNLKREFFPIWLQFIQASNNYAYYASIDTNSFQEHRRSVVARAEFVKNLDRSCLYALSEKLISHIELYHIHTWALVQLATIRDDAKAYDMDDLQINRRLLPILETVDAAREEARGAKEQTEASSRMTDPLWKRWHYTSPEGLHLQLKWLSEHLHRLRKQAMR